MAKVNSSIRGLTRTDRGWVDARGNMCKLQPMASGEVAPVAAAPAPAVEVKEVEQPDDGLMPIDGEVDTPLEEVTAALRNVFKARES